MAEAMPHHRGSRGLYRSIRAADGQRCRQLVEDSVGDKVWSISWTAFDRVWNDLLRSILG